MTTTNAAEEPTPAERDKRVDLTEDQRPSSAYTDPRPQVEDLPPGWRKCTPQEQARHQAAIAQAFTGVAVGDVLRRHTRPAAAGASAA